MTDDWKSIAEEGFRFFGKMSASISHEMKNALAIINENAGLMGDLIAFALKGNPLDPERLGVIADRIAGQVQRADAIVTNLNRFAHSADEPLGRIDLREAIALVADLSLRLASQREVRLEFRVPESPLMIPTRSFLLKNAIWRCLDFAMTVAGDAKTVIVIAEEKEGGPWVRFTELAGLRKSQSVPFPGDKDRALAEILKAEIILAKENREIVLRFPSHPGDEIRPGA